MRRSSDRRTESIASFGLPVIAWQITRRARPDSVNLVVTAQKENPMHLNVERARQIMDETGLDGLVAATPTNIYYLSDYYGPMLLMSHNYTMYAVYPRAEDALAALVMPAAGAYHLEHIPSWMPNLVGFTFRVKPGAGTPRDYDSTVEEYVDPDEPSEPRSGPDVPPMPYPSRGEEFFVDRDRQLKARYDSMRGRLEPTALYALRRALREAGLEKGRLGFDDPRVLGWLQTVGMKDLSGIDALNIFKRIRMVKTEEEIALLKIAGHNTEAALNDVIDAMEPGVELASLHETFAIAAAKRGSQAEWIVANLRGLATGAIEPNEIMKLDAVSSYRQYRGDVGRSVICGTPTDEMLRRSAAVTRGLQVAYENIRPGVPMKDIATLARETVQAEGFPGFVIAAPHSVGLEHTDHPTSIGPEMPGEHDIVFEENMVFTLDMPYHEFGWGTTHVEDMVIVRRDGCEPITSLDTALRIKPL
ncbi:aminopeptidase P family protein [Parasphingopyxis algicola]|uniref:M24 family metallopeptidase n=1 Tax=Parasphingopyxis algicola TaxID=2026624 RepID=UPI00159FDD8A|nr:M24 family metallopeptidase [Parasphingopyxis algicola]QLC26370.1 aminopeptidase P family protein [Parasphingopyxis algicola]